MATIKSYSDLQQSRKLEEFLPLESADMIWVLANPDLPIIKAIAYKDSEKSKYYEILPAWSLASLLELLPKRLEIMDNVHELSVYLYGLYYWNIVNGNLCFESKDKDNLVDACYEAIVFLHEQKLSL